MESPAPETNHLQEDDAMEMDAEERVEPAEPVAAEDESGSEGDVQVAEVHATEITGDDDGEPVLEAVVVEDDGKNAIEDEELSVATPVVAAEPPAKKLKPSTSPVPSAATSKPTSTPSSTSTASPKKKAPLLTAAGVPRKKPGPKPGTMKKKAAPSSSASSSKKKKSNSSSTSSSASSLPPHRVKAASDSRTLLKHTVKSLPANIGDVQVRSLGKLQAPSATLNPFVKRDALYAVGFSCDKYDFSVTHGRMLKLRCSILDGRRISQQRKSLKADTRNEPPLHDGPVFRIMWGRGVDEEDMDSYTYDSNFHSSFKPPKANGKAQVDKKQIVPTEDMRVRVRFDSNEYYTGTIVKVDSNLEEKSKKEETTLSIRYDDGSLETSAPFPDPDIELVMPGACVKVDSQLFFSAATLTTLTSLYRY